MWAIVSVEESEEGKLLTVLIQLALVLESGGCVHHFLGSGRQSRQVRIIAEKVGNRNLKAAENQLVYETP